MTEAQRCRSTAAIAVAIGLIVAVLSSLVALRAWRDVTVSGGDPFGLFTLHASS
jgi:hypothetical protein